MNNSFKANVNNSYEFDISEIEITTLDSIKTSSKTYHILKDNVSYKAEITDSDFDDKIYEVVVNDNTYNIQIINKLDVLVKEMGFEIGSSKTINKIKAPMPGLILEIDVKVGQEVAEDDTLLILEAMKMENIITSPRSGIIKSISVKKGDPVDKNHLLIEFE